MIHCKSTAKVWTDFHYVLCKVKDFSNSANILKFLDDSRLRSGNNREATWPWPNLRHYPTICLDRLVKIVNYLTHDSVLDETYLPTTAQESEANLLSCLEPDLFKQPHAAKKKNHYKLPQYLMLGLCYEMIIHVAYR